MKKILFLLLLTVVFGACESDTDSNWNNRPGGNSDDTQNWDSYVITVKNWERIGGVNADNSFSPVRSSICSSINRNPCFS